MRFYYIAEDTGSILSLPAVCLSVHAPGALSILLSLLCHGRVAPIRGSCSCGQSAIPEDTPPSVPPIYIPFSIRGAHIHTPQYTDSLGSQG